MKRSISQVPWNDPHCDRCCGTPGFFQNRYSLKKQKKEKPSQAGTGVEEVEAEVERASRYGFNQLGSLLTLSSSSSNCAYNIPAC